MAIDLLKEEENARRGKKKPPSQQLHYPVEMYIPPEETREQERGRKRKQKAEQKQRRTAEKQSKRVVAPDIEQEESVDLSGRYVQRQRLVRRLRAGIIVFLIALGVTAGAYGVWVLISSLPTEQTPPTTTPVSPQEPTEPMPTEPTPSEPTPQEPSGPLPDTELTPLAGALITFRDTTDIFLVENNGELRLVNQEAVIFDNGQTMNEISRRLIYLLPDRWQSIRRGQQVVSGRVDFDPRVLTTPELLPFIQE